MKDLPEKLNTEFTLPHLLINSASKFPTNEAVRLDGESLTYQQLDHLSDQLALTLRSSGVNPGDRVAILLHKSLGSIISVFGIMKAGAAYVPLDPKAPPARLAYITRNCRIHAIVSSGSETTELTAIFSESTPLRMVISVADKGELPPVLPKTIEYISSKSVYSDTEPPSPGNLLIESDLAYILYTSGSTGNPKGVMISHRTILTFINWCQDEFRLTPKDRITSHAPLHFDLSTFDIYATIKAGGTIILVGETASSLPVKLVDLLQDEKVTITYMVPSILSLMVYYGALASHDLSSLRTVLFAGEVFPLKHLRRLVSAIPHPVYYNLYGPTETNVCTFYQIQTNDLLPDQSEPIPIGRPIGNVDAFALDVQDQMVSEPGIEGELWVCGPCVAQGYWEDHDKTNSVFRQNPRNSLYPDIACQTGDIVKLSEDRQNWIYIGRRDHMVKTRGYRVELGEIESVLYGHELIEEAVVVAIPDEILGNRLRAFIVLVDGESVNPNEFGAFCSTKLPKYMVPERFEVMTALPKTSSGKIDRQILSATTIK